MWSVFYSLCVHTPEATLLTHLQRHDGLRQGVHYGLALRLEPLTDDLGVWGRGGGISRVAVQLRDDICKLSWERRGQRAKEVAWVTWVSII